MEIDWQKCINIHDIIAVARYFEIDDQQSQLIFIIKRLYDLFMEKDLSIIECNNLTLTPDNELIANHAHIRIDDYALYRQ